MLVSSEMDTDVGGGRRGKEGRREEGGRAPAGGPEPFSEPLPPPLPERAGAGGGCGGVWSPVMLRKDLEACVNVSGRRRLEPAQGAPGDQGTGEEWGSGGLCELLGGLLCPSPLQGARGDIWDP